MSDIVVELREHGAESTLIPNNAYVRAADEIEQLRANYDRAMKERDEFCRVLYNEANPEIERLRYKLKVFDIAIPAMHYRVEGNHCHECQREWPCDTFRLVRDE